MSKSTPLSRAWPLLLISFAVLCPPVGAQTTNTVFWSGYSLAVPIPAAPGDVINLFVAGVGSHLTGRVAASGVPLPTVLAAISVTFQQAIGPSGQPQAFPVPLLAVRPISTCLNGASSGQCGSYVAITLQIPVDLIVNTGSGPPNPARLVVSENGVAGGAIELAPRASVAHLLNLCDVQAASAIGCGSAPAITHGDGSLVSLVNPAKSGEELVMYLFGLGATTPSVATGQAAPNPPAVTMNQFQLSFDFRPNVVPSNQLIIPPVCQTTPICPQSQTIFSGLSPGFAGLYQVNFIVPSPPSGTPACNGSSVGTNLTVSLIGSTSFDGGGICVDTTSSSP